MTTDTPNPAPTASPAVRALIQAALDDLAPRIAIYEQNMVTASAAYAEALAERAALVAQRDELIEALAQMGDPTGDAVNDEK